MNVDVVAGAACAVTGALLASARVRGRAGEVIAAGSRALERRRKATDARLIEAAREVVRKELSRVTALGQARPGMVEIGVPWRHYSRLRGRESEVAADWTSHGGGGLRICLRETGGERLTLLSSSTQDATQRLGGAARLPLAGYITLAGVTSVLDGATCTVGRGSTNRVRCRSPYVSAVHATLGCDESGWLVHDHSSGGTWVNGVRLRPHEACRLHHGDSLRFADEEATFWGELP